jgi:hypothetical protein
MYIYIIVLLVIFLSMMRAVFATSVVTNNSVEPEKKNGKKVIGLSMRVTSARHGHLLYLYIEIQ